MDILPLASKVNFQLWWPISKHEIQLLDVYDFEASKNCLLFIFCEPPFTCIHIHQAKSCNTCLCECTYVTTVHKDLCGSEFFTKNAHDMIWVTKVWNEPGGRMPKIDNLVYLTIPNNIALKFFFSSPALRVICNMTKASIVTKNDNWKNIFIWRMVNYYMTSAFNKLG